MQPVSDLGTIFSVAHPLIESFEVLVGYGVFIMMPAKDVITCEAFIPLFTVFTAILFRSATTERTADSLTERDGI